MSESNKRHCAGTEIVLVAAVVVETRDSRLSYGEDPESLSHLGLNPYQVVTDRQTDRIPIANTRSHQYLPVLLWRVKRT